MVKGWKREPGRHSLAAKGVKTDFAKKIRRVTGVYNPLSRKNSEALLRDVKRRISEIGEEMHDLQYGVDVEFIANPSHRVYEAIIESIEPVQNMLNTVKNDLKHKKKHITLDGIQKKEVAAIERRIKVMNEGLMKMKRKLNSVVLK